MINSVKICQRFENKCFPYLEVSGSIAWSGIVEGVHGTWYMSLDGKLFSKDFLFSFQFCLLCLTPASSKFEAIFCSTVKILEAGQMEAILNKN